MPKTKVSRPKRHSNGQLTYGRWYISDWMASATVLGLSDAGYRLFHLVCLRVMERGPIQDNADVVRAICPGVRDFMAAWSEVRPLLATSHDGRVFQRRAMAEYEHGVAVCVQAAEAVAEREAKRDTSSDTSSDTSAAASEGASTDPSTQDPRPKNRQQIQDGAAPLAPTVAAPPTDPPAAPAPPPTASGVAGEGRPKKLTKRTRPPGAVVVATAHHEAALAWKPNARPGCLSAGSLDAYAAMLTVDGRDAAEAEALIRWLFSDGYEPRNNFDWRPNVLSGKALRKHYDRLEVEMQAARGHRAASNGRHLDGLVPATPEERFYFELDGPNEGPNWRTVQQNGHA